eukprot:4827334-Prymnesium_polylepis.2
MENLHPAIRKPKPVGPPHQPLAVRTLVRPHPVVLQDLLGEPPASVCGSPNAYGCLSFKLGQRKAGWKGMGRLPRRACRPPQRADRDRESGEEGRGWPHARETDQIDELDGRKLGKEWLHGRERDVSENRGVPSLTYLEHRRAKACCAPLGDDEAHELLVERLPVGGLQLAAARHSQAAAVASSRRHVSQRAVSENMHLRPRGLNTKLL